MKHALATGLFLFAAATSAAAESPEDMTRDEFNEAMQGEGFTGWIQDAGDAVSRAAEGVGRAASDAVKDVSNALAGMDPQQALKEASIRLAGQYHAEHPNANFEDCTIFVTGAVAAAGAYVGGPVGALLGGGAGVAASRVACRAWYP